MKADCSCGAPWDVPCICSFSEGEDMSDLKTTEGVLAWGYNLVFDFFSTDGAPDWDSTDIETAARLALAMRVLELVEREAASFKPGPVMTPRTILGRSQER